MNDVRGTVQCSSKMSGTPDLTLIFGNPSIIEDCSFHPCVRYARYERESVVSFVPPDGSFQLMTYRVVDRNPQAPLYCRPDVKYRDGVGRASFTIGSKPMASKAHTKTTTGGISSSGASVAPSDLQLEDIRLVISFPKAIKTIDLTPDVGTISVDPKTNVRCRVFVWAVLRVCGVAGDTRPRCPSLQQQ
jgi:AP-3 complex subunit mu